MNWSELVRLRIYLGESDTCQGESAALAMVKAARARKVRGATVFRGIMGFGKQSAIHAANILPLGEDLPLIVEIIDQAEKLETLLDDIFCIAPACLVTRERLEALLP